jgi:hypothetical protein
MARDKMNVAFLGGMKNVLGIGSFIGQASTALQGWSSKVNP